jgi:hypothetical protein
MSTDPKKFIKSIVLTYFLAGVMIAVGISMSYHFLPVIIFWSVSSLLYLSAIASLTTQYKKYRITIYKFLAYAGIIMLIIVTILSIQVLI